MNLQNLSDVLQEISSGNNLGEEITLVGATKTVPVETINLAIEKGLDIPKHTLEQILANDIIFPYKDFRPVALFKDYLKHGYYPFFKEKGYWQRLNAVGKALCA